MFCFRNNYSGKLTFTKVPSPAVDSIVIFPECSSTKFLTATRPNPVPSMPFTFEPLKNGVKT